jgi:hypothetical protein
MRWRTDCGALMFHTFLILIGTMRELATANAHTQAGWDSPTAIAWGQCYARCMAKALMHTPANYATDKAKALARQISCGNNVALTAPCSADAQIAWTALNLLATSYKVLCEAGLGQDLGLQMTGACFNRTYRAFIRHVCQPLYYCGPAHAARLQQLNFEAFSTELSSASQRRAYAFDAIFAHHALDAQSAAALGAIVKEADLAWMKSLDTLLRTHAPQQGPAFKPFYFAPRAATRASPVNPPVLVLTPQYATPVFG